MRKPAQVETARPRGRPRAFDRDAALRSAMRLFWRKGYAATSIADVTAATGVGSTSLYAAFGSKAALFAEALRRYGELYEDQVWAGFRAAATAREAMEALLADSAAALARPVRDGCPPGCMATLSAVDEEEGPALAALVRDARARLFGRVRSRLARAVEEGELGPGADVDALARLIVAVQNGMSIQARDGVGADALLAAARLALRGWDAWTGGRSG